jgi:hypothetical protein
MPSGGPEQPQSDNPPAGYAKLFEIMANVTERDGASGLSRVVPAEAISQLDEVRGQLKNEGIPEGTLWLWEQTAFSELREIRQELDRIRPEDFHD